MCLMSTWTSYEAGDVIPMGLSSGHHREAFLGFNPHGCLIASLSIFIEFMAVKEAKGIFLEICEFFFFTLLMYSLQKILFQLLSA